MSFLKAPGDLAETPLAAILLEALNLRTSGVLEVAHGGGTSRLWFRDGRPVAAQVFVGFKPLGLMLLQAGLIDMDALSRSLAAMSESRRPQGEILVEMGAVSADDVGKALAEQQAGYFGLIAALDAGRFSFDETAVVPEWTRGARLSPVRTIVDALERPQANALVASALQPVASSPVRLSSSYPEIEWAFRWSDAERALVARLARPVQIEAFLAPSGVGPERARAVLAGLLLLGLAAASSAAGDEPTIGIAIRREDLQTGTFPIPGGAAPEAAPAPTAGPGPTAGASPAAAAPRRSDPAEARARRQRLLQQAMRNMGVGPFARREGAPPPQAAPAATPVPAAPASAGAPPAAATGAEAQLRDALLAAAPRAREKDLFVRLGIPETAGKDEVKKAFLNLARQFHPDRFSSPALADLQDRVKDFFAAVNEAYETLSDDRKRTAYLTQRKSQGAVNAEAARLDFQKGEACIRTRDFTRARGFLESAVRADPRAEHQAALAWAIMNDPGARDREKARALALEAARDASCERAQYVAGIFARDAEDAGTAERFFRACLKANPKHADAQRELRLLESRRADRRRG
jgi:curved DNA-binding protein CbpA